MAIMDSHIELFVTILVIAFSIHGKWTPEISFNHTLVWKQKTKNKKQKTKKNILLFVQNFLVRLIILPCCIILSLWCSLTLNCMRYPALPLVHKEMEPPGENHFPIGIFRLSLHHIYIYIYIYTDHNHIS